jgi:hypothetical protein
MAKFGQGIILTRNPASTYLWSFRSSLSGLSLLRIMLSASLQRVEWLDADGKLVSHLLELVRHALFQSIQIKGVLDILNVHLCAQS